MESRLCIFVSHVRDTSISKKLKDPAALSSAASLRQMADKKKLQLLDSDEGNQHSLEALSRSAEEDRATSEESHSSKSGSKKVPIDELN